MAGTNGAAKLGSGATIDAREVEGLPEPELAPAGRALLGRRFLAREEGGAMEHPRALFWRVAVCVAGGSATFEGEEAQARRRRDYYLAMARLDLLPSATTLANAGRGNGRPLLPSFALALGSSAEDLLETGRRLARIRRLGGSVGLGLPGGGRVDSDAERSPELARVLELCGATARLTGGEGALQLLVPVDHPEILTVLGADGSLGRRQRLVYEAAAPYLGPEQRTALQRALANAPRDELRLVIGLTDRFLLAVVRGDDYALRYRASGAASGRLGAREVLGQIARSAHEDGEVGVVFLDRLAGGRANPVPDLGPLCAVTPSGEALYADEGCAVGFLNLARFYRPRPPRNGHGPEQPAPNGRVNGHAGFTRHPGIDWERLGRATRLGVRFLDDVLTVSPYPDAEIERAVQATRRLGLGVMGWADLLVGLEVPYDSPQAVDLADEVMRFIGETAADESCSLAEARGPFPSWERSIHAGGRPRRNATVTTVVGTGAVSLIAGVAGGIEPLAGLLAVAEPGVAAGPTPRPGLAEVAGREGFWSDDLLDVVGRTGSLRGDNGVPEYWQRVFATAADVAPEWHIRMQAAFQRHADSSVAKTIRLPGSTSTEEIEQVFRLAYELGCHGVAVHREGSEPLEGGPVPDGGSPEGEANEQLRPRPWMLQGLTFQEETPLGTAYVTVNVNQDGQPFEVFVNQGKTGSDVAALSVAIGKLSSLALRLPSPMSPERRLREVARRLRGIGGGSTWGSGPDRARSLPDALARVLERYLGQRLEGPDPEAERVSRAQLALPFVPTGEFCPDCSNALHFEEGASKCLHCGLVRS